MTPGDRRTAREGTTTLPPPEGDPGTPGAEPAEISNDEDLRAAVVRLLGTSDDRAVERRVGVSKTTVNDLRNGRRRLTLKTLTLIVAAYDPEHREAWLDVWHRLHPRVARKAPPAPSPTPPAAPSPAAAAEPPALAEAPTPTEPAATAEAAAPAETTAPDEALAPAVPAEPAVPVPPVPPVPPVAGGLSRRAAQALTGSALIAAVVAVTAMIFILADGDTPATPAPSALSAQSAGPVAPNGARPGASQPGVAVPGLALPGAAAPVGGPGPPANAGPLPAGGPSAGSGCYRLELPTEAAVVDGPGSAATGLRVTAGAYQYFASWSPSAAVGGKISGRPAGGQMLMGASWADPATTDSTAAHNPGNGLFYPGQVLELTTENCFTVQPYNLGYGGYTGITTRIYVLLVDAAAVPALPREAHDRGGLSEQDLAAHGAEILGYLTIPPPP
ncbi:helix-turn-helix transcriptional regulator [Parafrankia sp. EUN1f]|uniref:helix-turn-helix domain-containing protein n=1 Tax=Parafrankia sp. EUN1f TaxID=102897 RepID=UPI0001C46C2F|nr:helix-turn-helix transcriptional regulator [Parafrankia sp. EUN1f]EFC80693.1 hypothetical protein FrEUN1fDRAFT_6187 [Parafrankia sp. EUN1f]